MLEDGSELDFASSCTDQKRPLILVWGDSTASTLINGFRHSQASRNFGIAQFTVSSCPPLLVKVDQVSDYCLDKNRKIVDLIGDKSAEVVILQAFWSSIDTEHNLRPTIEALRARIAPQLGIAD